MLGAKRPKPGIRPLERLKRAFMIRSMTGFGKASITMPDGRDAVVEASAVNHKAQEFSIRLPQAWLCAEQPMRNLLRQRVSRGRVSVSARVAVSGSALVVRLDKSMALAYLAAFRELEALSEVPFQPITARDLAQLPGVFTHDAQESDEDAIVAALLGALGRALDMMDEARAAEGDSLARDMRERCAALRTVTEGILARAPALQEAYVARLRQRLEELAIEPGIREERLAMEAALMADRQDITEEDVRLKTHLDRF